MGKCTICQGFGGPHRFSSRPCAGHANRACPDCWKQHLRTEIVDKNTVITCIMCSKPLSKSQVQEGAAHIYEYANELMKVVAAQKTATEPAKLKAGGAAGERAAGEAGKADDTDGFVMVEKDEADSNGNDDWVHVDGEEM